ncbi:DNA polymerase III subunit chi [Aurantivibrio plasticivorans]
MPQVDFYVLPREELSARLEFVCRLAEKLFKMGKPTQIALPDQDSVKQLDQMLWAYPAEAFIPHSCDTPSNSTPNAMELIHLSVGSTPRSDAGQGVLINLCPSTVEAPAAFERLVEVVVKAPEVLTATRQHFKTYRELGYSIQSHDIAH